MNGVESYAYDEAVMLKSIRDWKAESRERAQTKIVPSKPSTVCASSVSPLPSRKPPQQVRRNVPGSAVLRGKVEATLAVVSATHSVPRELLLSRCQEKSVVAARNVAAYILREWTTLSLSQLGKIFDRHHTSILYALNTTRQRMIDDPRHAERVLAMRNAAMALLGMTAEAA